MEKEEPHFDRSFGQIEKKKAGHKCGFVQIGKSRLTTTVVLLEMEKGGQRQVWLGSKK